jgi:hypothetical protein
MTEELALAIDRAFTRAGGLERAGRNCRKLAYVLVVEGVLAGAGCLLQFSVLVAVWVAALSMLAAALSFVSGLCLQIASARLELAAAPTTGTHCYTCVRVAQTCMHSPGN